MLPCRTSLEMKRYSRTLHSLSSCLSRNVPLRFLDVKQCFLWFSFGHGAAHRADGALTPALCRQAIQHQPLVQLDANCRIGRTTVAECGSCYRPPLLSFDIISRMPGARPQRSLDACCLSGSNIAQCGPSSIRQRKNCGVGNPSGSLSKIATHPLCPMQPDDLGMVNVGSRHTADVGAVGAGDRYTPRIRHSGNS